MESVFDRRFTVLTKRIERLKSGISQIRNDVEYGSFITLPAMRARGRLNTEAPTRAEEEMSQLLFLGELILLESKGLFEKLQDVERIVYDADEIQTTKEFAKAEESLRKIEKLHRSRSSSEGFSLDALISGYEEKVDDVEKLAEKEDLFALEQSQLAGALSMNKGSLFKRFMSRIARKPVFEKEIADAILLIADRLKTKTGGLVRLPALYSMVKTVKPSLNISMQDVEKVVRDLQKEGIMPGLREVSGTKMVEMVPVTATPDQNLILEMASEAGKLDLERVLMKTKWTHERATRALKQMEELGIARYDVTAREWTFPAFTEDQESAEKEEQS
jgi:hypothetical protein